MMEGALLVFLISLLVVLPLGLFLFILMPFMFGASYEGSSRKVVRKIVEFSGVKKGERFVDLGSGDGRLVREFARAGAESHGYEVNPVLVLWSRWRIWQEGLKGKAFVHFGNFWGVDLWKYDIISLFQISWIMGKLERKLKKELKKGARIVSNKWKFPNWELIKKSDVGTGVYLYVKD
jgi:hypothetical protein